MDLGHPRSYSEDFFYKGKDSKYLDLVATYGLLHILFFLYTSLKNVQIMLTHRIWSVGYNLPSPDFWEVNLTRIPMVYVNKTFLGFFSPNKM